MLYIDLQPGQTCHSKVMHRKEVTHSDGSYEKKSHRRTGLKKWDKVKIPWYTHRLMHRKRVICELHDNYFRLMTNKHAIPKIEWAIELLYNSVWTGSQWVGDQRSRRQDVVEKATTQQKGLLGPPIEFGDQLVRRCWNENMSQRGWAPRPLVEQSRWTRTTHGDVRRGWGGQCVAVFVQSPIPSHSKTLSNPFRTLTIKWEVHIFLKKSSLVFIHCVNMYSACICV